MKNLLLTIFMVFFLCGSIFSQTFEISGKVVNGDNDIIPFANILLLSSKDSTFVKGHQLMIMGILYWKRYSLTFIYCKRAILEEGQNH